jgi:formate dehydrogenase major subunit
VDRFADIVEKHGPDALAGVSSARCPNEENYLMQKFFRVQVGTNNIDSCARVCHSLPRSACRRPSAPALPRTASTT